MFKALEFIPKDIIAFLGISFGLTLAFYSYFFENIKEYQETFQNTYIDVKVINAQDRLYNLLRDEEAGQRGFILTHRNNYLYPYYDAKKELPKTLQEIETLIKQNSLRYKTTSVNLPVLKNLIRAKEMEMNETIAMVKAGQSGKALRVVMSDKGRRYMQEIWALLNSNKISLDNELTLRHKKIDDKFNKIIDTFFWGGVFVFILLTGAIYRLWQEIIDRRRYEAELFELNHSLEETVSVRTNELHLEKQALHHSEIMLREQYNFTKSITDGMQEGIYCIDVKKNINFINQAGARMLGYTVEELIGKNAHETLHYLKKDGSAYPLSDCPLIHVVREGVIITNYEDVFTHKEGQLIPIVFSSSPLMKDNKITGAVVSFQDISLIKKAQKDIDNAKKETEEQFKTLTEAMPQIVWTASPSGGLTYINQRWYEYSGSEPEELLEEGWIHYVHPEDIKKTMLAWKQAIKTGERYNTEFRLKDKTGAYRWHLARALSVQNQDNKTILNWFGTYTDIQDLVDAKEVISRSQEDLEKLVEMRTSELQAVNSELESFSYSISHDLRSPLRSIAGFSQALMKHKREYLDSEAQDFLNRILANTTRMGRLIDDILRLSRLSRESLKIETVNLSQLVLDIARTLQEQNPDRKATFVIQPDLYAQCDTTLIGIVLQNLIENAWKFTGNKSDAIIEFGQSIKEKTVFYVKDNGDGFDMKYVDKLFGVFQRLHAMEEFPGTGIGLATVKRIIHRHNGQVWADSIKNKETTFYFSL